MTPSCQSLFLSPLLCLCQCHSPFLYFSLVSGRLSVLGHSVAFFSFVQCFSVCLPLLLSNIIFFLYSFFFNTWKKIPFFPPSHGAEQALRPQKTSSAQHTHTATPAQITHVCTHARTQTCTRCDCTLFSSYSRFLSWAFDLILLMLQVWIYKQFSYRQH